MGRKIPKRKHFGIRDPIKQNQDRLALWVKWNFIEMFREAQQNLQ